MKNRIIEFDYIRIISLIGILLCHSLLGSFEYTWVGRYLGLTFNFLFLILSAFLLGLSWENKGKPKYRFEFLSKRIVRLSKSYYPYLAILFLFLYIAQDYHSMRNIISHILYLPWFDKIDGFGHLWFMTMIVLCYAGCFCISRINLNLNTLNRLNMSILIFVGGGYLDYLTTEHNLPGYIFPYLIGYVLIFYNAKPIIIMVRKIRLVINIIQFMVVNGMGIILFHNRLFDLNPFISYLIGIVCATSLFCVLFNICSKFPYSRMIIWLSGISFEVYLVHEFFLGKYSIYNLQLNPFWGFIALIALSVIASLPIHYLAKYKSINSLALK